MPFLCCFARNPFLGKSKRSSHKTSSAQAPRMVQIQRDTQRNATTVAVPRTQPATTQSRARRSGPKQANLNYIDRKLAANEPPKSRALNPNQKWHLPSYAPPPPRASPVTSHKVPQTRYRVRDQPHPIYASGSDNDTTWIRRSDQISSCGIGSPLHPVPKQAKKKSAGWTSSSQCRGPEMTFYIETAAGGSTHGRDPFTTPPLQIIRRAI